jgi:hypothetical protein
VELIRIDLHSAFPAAGIRHLLMRDIELSFGLEHLLPSPLSLLFACVQ